MRIVKAIIMFISAAFWALVTAGGIGSELDHSQAIADMYAPLFMTVGFTAVSLAAGIRSIKKKKWVILPALGMSIVMFVFAISVGGFANFAYKGDASYLGAGIVMGAPAAVLTVWLHWLKRDSSKHDITAPAAEFSGYSAEWYFDEIEEEYCAMNGIDPDETDGYDRDELCDKFYVYGCNYISYIYVWLMKHGWIVDPADGSMYSVFEIVDEAGDAAEFIYRTLDGKLCRDDISGDILPFMDAYYERTENRVVREVSYGVDYDEIAVHDEVTYCLDFSWQTYHRMEERLDQRYSEFICGIPAEAEQD